MLSSKLAKVARLTLGFALALTVLVSIAWAFKPDQGLRDFGSFVAAGDAHNRGDNPYGVYADTYAVNYRGEAIAAPNLNPPVSIYPFRLLASFEPANAKLGLQAGSITVYAAVLFFLMRRRPQHDFLIIGWAVSLAGFWHTLALGQIYILLLALMAAAWLLQPKRPLAAGLLLGGLIAIKPAFVVWPLFLFLSGERRTSLGSVATAGAISLVPLLIEGPQIYQQWLQASRDFAGAGLPGNSSVVGLAARVGAEEAGLALAAGFIAALAVWVKRRRLEAAQVGSLAIVVALLAGPITWAGYTLFALPVLLSRRWQGWEWAAALPLAVPLAVVYDIAKTGQAAHVIAGSFYVFSLVVTFGLVVNDARRRSQEASTPNNADLAAARPLAA